MSFPKQSEIEPTYFKIAEQRLQLAPGMPRTVGATRAAHRWVNAKRLAYAVAN
jgi:hypothetical protein